MMRLSTFRSWLMVGWTWGLFSFTVISTGLADENVVQSAMGDLSEFQDAPANWSVAGGISGDLRHSAAITIEEGSGLWVNHPDENTPGNLVTRWSHGDLIVEFDYLLPAESTAVLSFQGRYEVTLPQTRAPGLWQHARIEFQAARFGADGKPTTEARLVSQIINGTVTSENLKWNESGNNTPTSPVAGAGDPGPASPRPATIETNPGNNNPTRLVESSPEGPLVIHGDRGPLALRNFAVQHLTADQVAIQNLHYQIYHGEFSALDDYRHQNPTLSGETNEISETLADTTDAFAMVITGEIVIPQAGWYHFSQKTDVISQTRLKIDGTTPVSVGSSGEDSQIRLAAGTHPFRLDYLRPGERGKPLLVWSVTGPDMRPQPLSFSAANPPNPIPVVPIEIEEGRVHTHRCFFPYADSKRLYVAAVGTQEHVHYAYDLEWQNLLTVWRGDYLDAGGIWHQRGGIQQVVPIGSAIELGSGPSLAVLANPDDTWPDPEAAAREAAGEDFDPEDNGSGPPTALINLPSPLSSQGYTLAPNGQPTFQFTAYGLAIEDHWVVSPGHDGLIRTLTFAKPIERDDLYLLLARESHIGAQSGYFILGDRKAYLEGPADPNLTPEIHAAGANQELRVHLPAGTRSITYRLIW